MPETFSLRALTFNAWGLPITIPSQRKRQRLNRLPSALAEIDADIIVLQELFDVRARNRILGALCPAYSTTQDARHTRRILGLVPADVTGGLLVLSRFPVINSRYREHPLGRGAKPDERLGRKGALIVRVETPVGPLTVLALHLYAGTRIQDSRFRMTQLPGLLSELDIDADGEPIMLAGDINVSPTVRFPAPPGPDNPYTPEYEALTSAGFLDPPPPNPTPHEESVTWVPSSNRFAALPYQETKSDERYDYLLVKPGQDHAWSLGPARTVFKGRDALSDHFGVVADLVLRIT